MVIRIGDVSVSIPVAISSWAKESKDNETEFNGMIESMMYAVNKVMKERNHVEPNPYQPLYEAQLKMAEEIGWSKEDVDRYIKRFADELTEETKSGNFKSDKEWLIKLLQNIS